MTSDLQGRARRVVHSVECIELSLRDKRARGKVMNQARVRSMTSDLQGRARRVVHSVECIELSLRDKRAKGKGVAGSRPWHTSRAGGRGRWRIQEISPAARLGWFALVVLVARGRGCCGARLVCRAYRRRHG